MKTMIAIPCMQTVPTRTFRSVEYLRRLPDTYTFITENTLIHDARNDACSIAIENGFDRVLWIDSDMTFPADALMQLTEDMNRTVPEKTALPGANVPMVCGLFFRRFMPTSPVIYSDLRKMTAEETAGAGGLAGECIKPVTYEAYPRDGFFPVAACGFGFVMTSVPLLKAVWDRYKVPPFSYYGNLGEDLSFCWRVRELGEAIYCDSYLKCGHIGQAEYSEASYRYPEAASAERGGCDRASAECGDNKTTGGR